jgi:hypothetical protein
MHLIPRFASLDPMQAWDTPNATKSTRFPQQYRRDAGNFDFQVRPDHPKTAIRNEYGKPFSPSRDLTDKPPDV